MVTRRLRHSGQPWLPVMPPDIAVWSKADEITGVAPNGTMSVWHDISGLGRHWSVGGGTPKYRATQGPTGGPAVGLGVGSGEGYFVAHADLLTALGNGGNGAEMFVVVTVVGTAGNAGAWDFSNALQSAHYDYADTNVIYEDFGSTNREGPMSGGTLTNTWRLYNPSGKTGAQVYRLDGSVIGSFSNSFSMANGLLGQTSNFNCANTVVAEIIMFARVLTAAQRAQVNAYFRARYGLAIA